MLNWVKVKENFILFYFKIFFETDKKFEDLWAEIELQLFIKMWYHSLKTRQSVKRINARNSGGVAVALEYIDKKIEVHHLTV